MRKLVLVAVVLSCLASVGSAQSPTLSLGSPDWNSYAPREPFTVHQFYQNPYTEVIYIADVVYLHDGTAVLAVENIRGRWCKSGRGCLIPADTKRGTWVPVDATLGGGEQ